MAMEMKMETSMEISWFQWRGNGKEQTGSAMDGTTNWADCG